MSFLWRRTYDDNGIIGPGYSRWCTSKELNTGNIALVISIIVLILVVVFIVWR